MISMIDYNYIYIYIYISLLDIYIDKDIRFIWQDYSIYKEPDFDI